VGRIKFGGLQLLVERRGIILLRANFRVAVYLGCLSFVFYYEILDE
jgi:hypothetical protein